MARLSIDWERLPHKEKFDRLFCRFKELRSVLVAYSGGVDSTLLLKIGKLAIGDACVGVIAQSETLTDDEFEAAEALARDHCFNFYVIQYSELEIEHYAENPVNRCYFCKQTLFSRLQQLSGELNVRAIVDGTNADDVGDHRPGMQAAAELQVLSPLREAGMTKREIRELALALGLPNWDKPSAPCLSSRVAYGLKIDREKLRQVGEGEKFLRELGFRELRVRHHGDLARVEVAPAELDRLLQPEIRARVAERLRALGFRYVTVDLQGYRRGSLNEFFRVPKADSITIQP